MEDSGKSRKLKIAIAVLALLLIVSCVALGVTLVLREQDDHPTVTVPVETASPELPVETTTETAAPELTQPTAVATLPTKAPGSSSSSSASEQEATLLRLHKQQGSDVIPFYAANMFPGDSVTRYFCVRVSHSDSVTLRYHASIRPGYEKLGEGMKVRIFLPATGELLYDGVMEGMPASLNRILTASQQSTEDLLYEITVYLDTSAGNEYQSGELVADLQWWIEETDFLTSPKTGDSSLILLWSVLAVLSALAVLVLLYLLYRVDPRLARLLMVLLVLALLMSGLCVTAFAAFQYNVTVRQNMFYTGTVSINLNDGEAVTEDEMFTRFEPGMTAGAKFFIENESTDPVYYKLYFRDIEGSLADVLEVTVTTADGSRVLYDTTVSDFTRTGVGIVRERLELNQRQELMIWFHFPENAGNAYRQQSLSFTLCADAVQTKNNPTGDFD